MRTIIINNPGPQGAVGPQGNVGPSGSTQPFSNVSGSIWATTSSLEVTGSLTVSGSTTTTTLALQDNVFKGTIIGNGLTTSKNFYLPDKQGTFALREDLPTAENGLTRTILTPDVFKLGGVITQNTTLSDTTNTYLLTLDGIGLTAYKASDDGSAVIKFSRAAGSPSSPQNTLAYQYLGVLAASGYSGGLLANSAALVFQAAEDYVSAGSIGANVKIMTTPIGSNISNTVATFQNDGNVGIGITTPSHKLDVSGSGRFTDGLTITGSVTISGSSTFTNIGPAVFSGSVNATSGVTMSSALVSGDVTVLGTASINVLQINTTINSTGSNTLGDNANDTQTLYGSVVIPTGSLTVSGSVSFGTSSAGLFWNNTNNRLGIGTSSPASTLHVNGEIRLNAGQSLLLDVSNNIYVLGAGNQFRIYSGGTASLNIATNGNTLIGTTTDSGAKLHISGSTSQALLIASSSAGPALFVSGSGNIGIGTATPVSKINVVTPNNGDALRLEVPSTNSTVYDFYLGNSGTTSYIRANPIILEFRRQGNPSTIRTVGGILNDLSIQSDGGILLSTYGTNERMRIVGSTGNVLIGTATDQSSKLNVRGSGTTSATTALRVENTNASASMVVLDNGYVGINTGSAQYNLDVNGTGRFTGTLIAGTGIVSGDTITFSNTGNTSRTGFSFASYSNALTTGALTGYNTIFTFNPSSGNATYTGFHFTSGINQTGGANGITRGIYIQPAISNAFDFRAIESNNGRVVIADTATVTGSNATSLLDLSQTWNTSGTPTAIKLNITDTTSNGNSRLLDVQLGGVSKLIFAKNGQLFFGVFNNSSNIQGDDTTRGLILRTSLTTTAGSGFLFSNLQGSIANLSGQSNGLYIQPAGTIGFNPTSGTGIYNSIQINDIINQTGGANGITRGLYINPTLTSATNFRAIETNAGNVLFQSGSTPLLFVSSSGNVGIGTSTPDSYYAKKLVVSAVDESGITIAGTTTSATNYLAFADGTSGNQAYRGYVAYKHLTDQLAFGTGGTLRATIDNSGNFGIGTSTSTILARTHIQGSGTTSATTALRVENTNASASMVVLDNGYVGINTGSAQYNLDVNGTARVTGNLTCDTFNLFGSVLTLNSANIGGLFGTRYVNSVSYAAGHVFQTSTGNVFATSGDTYTLQSLQSVAFTSGTATYTSLRLAPTISQTGGANGITRGLYVNPTLTAAADFRAIETTAGNIIFGGTGSVTISNVLTLTPQSPLPSGVATGSFAVSSSVPPKPYFYDGTTWNALY
jgi:hypothetical protein